MKRIKHTLKIIFTIFRLSFGKFTAYRLNLLFFLFSTFVWLATAFLFFEGIFGNVDSLVGYDKADMFLFLGIGQLVFVVWASVITATNDLDSLIRTYDLDIYLLKPVNQMLFTTLRRFNFDIVMSLFSASVNFVIAFRMKSYEITLINVMLFIVSFCLCMMVLYLIQLLFNLSYFWAPRSDAKYLANEFWNSMRYPIEIYGKNIFSFILTFVLPFLIIVNVPYHALVGDLEMWWLAVLCIYIFVIYIFTSWLWRVGVKRYCDVD